jgi:hypothetical protein
MQEITIGNLRNKPAHGHRCDRLSPLGNPFNLKSEKFRDFVCDAFQEYFDLVVAGGIEPKIAMLDVALQQSGILQLAINFCKNLTVWRK